MSNLQRCCGVHPDHPVDTCQEEEEAVFIRDSVTNEDSPNAHREKEEEEEEEEAVLISVVNTNEEEVMVVFTREN